MAKTTIAWPMRILVGVTAPRRLWLSPMRPRVYLWARGRQRNRVNFREDHSSRAHLADAAPAAATEPPLHAIAANEARNGLPAPRLNDISPRDERELS